MLPGATIDRDLVRDELRVDDVINAYGLKVKRRGSQYRLRECPRCRASVRRESVVIDSRTGAWLHHGHEREAGGECSGFLLELVAACEGLDTRRDFPRVLERAAKIAGVEARPLTDNERAERAARRARAEVERQRQEAVELRESKLRATQHWSALLRWHQTGAAYLRHRGLDAAALVGADHVRFAIVGEVCSPLWAFDGELLNVARRVYEPSDEEPKVVVLPGCPTRGTLLGRLSDITNGADVMITEGLMDALTAAQLWPERIILGANGAGQMPPIAEAVASRIADLGGTLWLVPHNDDVGQRRAVRAGEHAIEAGLVMDETLRVVELEHKDLNEAHCAGWKP